MSFDWLIDFQICLLVMTLTLLDSSRVKAGLFKILINSHKYKSYCYQIKNILHVFWCSVLKEWTYHDKYSFIFFIKFLIDWNSFFYDWKMFENGANISHLVMAPTNHPSIWIRKRPRSSNFQDYFSATTICLSLKWSPTMDTLVFKKSFWFAAFE